MSPSVDLHELSAGKSLHFVAEITPGVLSIHPRFASAFLLLLLFTHVMILGFGVAG